MFNNLIKTAEAKGLSWGNWAGNVHSRPQAIFYPRTEEELQNYLFRARSEGLGLKVVGSGHSFTPIAASDEFLVDLRHLRGLIEADKAKHQATVYAGTTIHDLGEILYEQGMAQINLGDIDKQSVAGACSTGTHGTGVNFGTLSTQIIGFRLLTASGEYLDCSATENPEIFQAGRIGLGALGILTRVTIQAVPSYKLKAVSVKGKLHKTLERIERYNSENRNFEFYWIPYTNTVQLKFSNETQAPVNDPAWKRQLFGIFLENKVLGALCRWGRRSPGSYNIINAIIAKAISREEKINYSHKVYASVRDVRFKEMEYNIPAEHFVTVMRELKALMEREEVPIFFPIECRWVKADDIWLSPAYGRDSAYIALHVFEGTEHTAYFRAAEALFMRYGGRPHWGKMHTRTAANLAEAYPRWQDFLDLRAKLDPQGLFLTPYLRRLFGLVE